MENSSDKDDFSKIVDEVFARKSADDIPEYTSFEQKKEFYGRSANFDSATLFFNFWEGSLPEQIRGHQILFRGVSDASYRLLSKAQRNYIANKKHFFYQDYEYHGLIKEMVACARSLDGHLLSKFFRAFGRTDNDIAVLSFLQHYGAPTPLLDWTTNLNVALYFATAQLSDLEVEKHYLYPASDINSYVSIYVLDVELVKAYTSTFKQLNFRNREATSYDKILKKKLAYIVEHEEKNKPVFTLRNNFNILSQEGVFIYNNSAFQPLEEVVLVHSTMYYVAGKMRGINETAKSPIICLNINKCIIKHIRKYLSEKGITARTIFPDAGDIARRAIPPMLS